MDAARAGLATMAEALGGRVKTPRPSRAPAERPTQPAAAATPPRAAATTPQSTRSNGSGAVTAPQQRILDQLAWLELHDIYPAPKETLAAVCGVSPTSGGYFNNLGRLRSCGLIDYPEPGLVALTNAGRAAAHLPDDSRPVHERSNAWDTHVSHNSACHARIHETGTQSDRPGEVLGCISPQVSRNWRS